MGMARSFQNIRLMPHLSVVENVMLGQHARPGLLRKFRPVGVMPRARERTEALALLDAFGLDPHRGQVVANLPYGVRKKIEVVRALMANPDLLLLDEPAAGLNSTETAALRDFAQKLATEVADSGSEKLLEPMSEESPIHKFLERRGPGIHHVCMRTDDVNAEDKKLRAKGFHLLRDQPSEGAEGALVQFLHPKTA